MIKKITIIAGILIYLIIPGSIYASHTATDINSEETVGTYCESNVPGQCPKDTKVENLANGEHRCTYKSCSAQDIIGNVAAPAPIAKIGFGATGVSNFISRLLGLIYTGAIILFLFMIIWAAFNWITAGGDKENVAKARSKIINASIGLLILALSGIFVRVAGEITGFKIFAPEQKTEQSP